MKSKRLPIVFLIISICLIVLGYFLWTILFPVQDINLMSAEELLTLQKEVALNYELGRIMMYVGGISAIISLVFMLRVRFQRVDRDSTI